MNNASATENTREIYRRVDPEYKHKLHELHNGDTLRFCYQCGACTASCPLSQLIRVYRPNKILELAKLGIRNIPQSNAFVFCSACTQCTKGCPQGVRVHEIMHALKDLAIHDQDAIDYIADGFEDALDTLAVEIPFPVSYSWISLSPPDNNETDGFYGPAREALLSYLKRLKREAAPQKEGAPAVAVIGSGPAGLTAAMELRKAGYPVTVFEPLPEAGGMLMVGIPSYRLPKDIVAAEVDGIKSMGVEIRTNTPADKALFEKLLNDGEYKAVFIATGAPMARGLRIDGEALEGVVTALDFLRGFNLNEGSETGKNVVVVGGGNVGIDAARTALRCGAETVRLFCLESRAEMPSHEWEILEAAAEGVVIEPSFGPKEILGENGRVTGVEFIRCKSVFGADGRFDPVYDEKTTQTVEADMVITAIGQAPDTGFLQQMIDITRGAITVDPLTMETSLDGVFAGGDTVSGTASLIEAIVAGRTAASSIIRHLEKQTAPAG